MDGADGGPDARSAAHLEVLHRVASAANRAESLEEAASEALAVLCRWTGWPVGHLYVDAGDGSGDLAPADVWHLADPAHAVRLVEATMRTRFRRGEGIPGAVAAAGRPCWVVDTAARRDLPRWAGGADLGVGAAFAFPVLVRDDVAAVVELFADGPHEPDDVLLDVVGNVGLQLGRVVERQQAREALRTSEYRLRRTIETANDAFVGMDASGVVTDWNARSHAMFGWTGEEACGRELAELVIPERFRAAHRRGLEHFLATGEGPVLGRPVELAGVHRDGHEFPLELTVWAVPHDAAWTFNAFLRDVSERKGAEEELRARAAALEEANAALRVSDAVKDEFIAVTSHELRTPLTAILGYASTLEGRWERVPDQARLEAVRVIRRQAQQLHGLVSDLLTTSTIQAGALELHREPTRVRTVLDRAVQATGVPADVRCPPTAEAYVDPTRFEQVVVNLLSNAAKYGEPPIELAVEVTGRGAVEVRVEDHGAGVPDDFVGEMFERFTQASRGDRRRAKGTGLGLSIVRSLVEAHGGAVRYERAPAGGACFVVTLPGEDAQDTTDPGAGRATTVG